MMDAKWVDASKRSPKLIEDSYFVYQCTDNGKAHKAVRMWGCLEDYENSDEEKWGWWDDGAAYDDKPRRVLYWLEEKS